MYLRLKKNETNTRDFVGVGANVKDVIADVHPQCSYYSSTMTSNLDISRRTPHRKMSTAIVMHASVEETPAMSHKNPRCIRDVRVLNIRHSR